MSINFNGNTTDPKKVNFNGSDVKRVNFKKGNIIQTAWVKPYTLTRHETPGAVIDVEVTKSEDPIRKKKVDNGLFLGQDANHQVTIYYQDQLVIDYRAEDGYNLISHSDTTSVDSVTGDMTLNCCAQSTTLTPVTLGSSLDGYVSIKNSNYVPVIVTLTAKANTPTQVTTTVPAATYNGGIFDIGPDGKPSSSTPGTMIVDAASLCTTNKYATRITAEAKAVASGYTTSSTSTTTVLYNLRPPEEIRFGSIYSNSKNIDLWIVNENPIACTASIVITDRDCGISLFSGFYSIQANTGKTYTITLNDYPELGCMISAKVSFQHASYGESLVMSDEAECMEDTSTTA